MSGGAQWCAQVLDRVLDWLILRTICSNTANAICNVLLLRDGTKRGKLTRLYA